MASAKLKQAISSRHARASRCTLSLYTENWVALFTISQFRRRRFMIVTKIDNKSQRAALASSDSTEGSMRGNASPKRAKPQKKAFPRQQAACHPGCSVKAAHGARWRANLCSVHTRIHIPIDEYVARGRDTAQPVASRTRTRAAGAGREALCRVTRDCDQVY